MFHLGTPELIIILVIVVLVFGVGRIGQIAGEMGKGLREFQKSIKGDEVSSDPAEKKD